MEALSHLAELVGNHGDKYQKSKQSHGGSQRCSGFPMFCLLSLSCLCQPLHVKGGKTGAVWERHSRRVSTDLNFLNTIWEIGPEVTRISGLIYTVVSFEEIEPRFGVKSLLTNSSFMSLLLCDFGQHSCCLSSFHLLKEEIPVI